ncbi:MAG: NYN domain-containing protein [archaeon]
MNVMIFVDYDNFCRSIWAIDNHRQPKISKLQNYLIDYLQKKLGWQQYAPLLARTYCYTGEYADTTITKIKKHFDEETNPTLKSEIKEILDDAQRRQGAVGKGGQKDFFYKANCFDFFELKTKPLQYSREKKQIFQKGVDVQLAVDLVSHAFHNNFDVAIICSGDVDLLEALKLVKSLGKKVVVFSNPSNAAKEVRKEADHFINLANLEENELNVFSYSVIQRKQN